MHSATELIKYLQSMIILLQIILFLNHHYIIITQLQYIIVVCRIVDIMQMFTLIGVTL